MLTLHRLESARGGAPEKRLRARTTAPWFHSQVLDQKVQVRKMPAGGMRAAASYKNLGAVQLAARG
jgi:hypothetical protein